VLACEGVQCVATFRLAALIAKGVVDELEEGTLEMRLDSFKAPREALNVDIVCKMSCRTRNANVL
jgi:hypothetical protein